jgi:hypothetical protein
MGRDPRNTTHNFLDMVLRGCSKQARKDFAKNQEYERKTRAENRARRKADADGSSDAEDPLPRSKSMPDIVSGTSDRIAGYGTRRSNSTYGRPSDDPSSIRPYRPSAILPSSPLRPPRPGSQGGSQATRYDTSRPVRPPHPPGSNPKPSSRKFDETRKLSAVPLTKSSGSSSHRVPTEKAPLGDPQRTFVDGFAPPTGRRSTVTTLQRPPRRSGNSKLGPLVSGRIGEASAFPLTEASRSRSKRVPTEKAPLGDPQRTFIEGFAPPTGNRSATARRPLLCLKKSNKREYNED